MTLSTDSSEPASVNHSPASTRIAVVYCEPVIEADRVIDFRYVWGNQIAHQLPHVFPPVPAPKTMRPFYAELGQPELFERCVQVWQTGQTQQWTWSQPTLQPPGWLSLTVEKRPEGLLVTALDVTRQEQLRQHYQQQADLLRNLVNNTQAGLALFEPVREADGQISDFRYALTNPANARTTGQSVTAMTGKRLLELFPNVGRGLFYERIREVLTTGQSQQYQEYYEGDGMAVWVDATLVRVDDHVLLTFQDITPLVIQRNELEAAWRAAEEALKVRDIFLSNISHEIRTPLNSVMGFSELLAGQLTDPEQSAYAGYIREAGYTLLKLINNVLDLAKLEANQFELEIQPLSLHQVIGSVASILGARARQKGLTFVYETPADVPDHVLADSLRLTQVVMNLCDNAVKFTNQGQVELKVWADHLTPETVHLVIEVSDTGTGIPTDRLSTIFDRFQQASAQVARHYGGTGLGLNIVQNLVNRMGGRIAVRSQVGQGTIFRVNLPLARSPQTDAVAPAAVVDEAPLSTLPARILLVEDNIFNQRVVEGITKGMDVQLFKAANGLEALASLRKQPVDLVLMDIQMPLMNGYQTTRHIRSTLRLTTPVVALTANTLADESEDYRAWGIDAYLTKPFTRRQLLHVIQQQTHSPASAALPAQSPVSRINRAVLADLYVDDWAFIREQCDAFQEAWPRHCRELSESLERDQMSLFRQQAHTFSTTLHSLGIMETAKQLKQLSRHYEQRTATERSEQWGGLVDEIEEALSELYQLSRPTA